MTKYGEVRSSVTDSSEHVEVGTVGAKRVLQAGWDGSTVNDAFVSKQGALLEGARHPNAFEANENHATAQTNNQLQAAPGASTAIYITDIIISNGATAGNIKLVEDEGGTPSDVAGPFYFAANGGMAKRFVTPLKLTDNKSLGFTSTSVTTHTVTVVGYTE
jgi:hypothetical protein